MTFDQAYDHASNALPYTLPEHPPIAMVADEAMPDSGIEPGDVLLMLSDTPADNEWARDNLRGTVRRLPRIHYGALSAAICSFHAVALSDDDWRYPTYLRAVRRQLAAYYRFRNSGRGAQSPVVIVTPWRSDDEALAGLLASVGCRLPDA